MTYAPPEFILTPLFPFKNTGFSPEAETVSNKITKIRDWLEDSQALYGEKTKAISLLSELADECGVENWDGYGGRPIDIDSVTVAESFVRALPRGVTLPEFAPEPDGSISLEWIPSRTCTFSISINSSDHLAYAWINGTDRGHAVTFFDGYRIPPRILEEIETVTG